MKFKYFEGAQRTPEWFKLRLGVPTASQLYRWKSVSKRDGKPLKGATDYEKELMFERQFGTSFEKFVSSAMEEGVDYEAFGRKEYERITGSTVNEVGAWYNDHFVASPDGDVIEKGKKKPTGLLEVKWLKDTNWTEVLESQKPYVGSGADHQKQVQGQMFASGRKWTDYVAGNLNTKKLIIIRVKPDKEYFKELEETLVQPLTVKKFKLDNVYGFEQALTEGELTPEVQATEDVIEDIKELGF